MLSNNSVRQCFRFGFFEFNPQSGELRRRGTKVHLQAQTSELLALLLQYAGELVTREQLRAELWHGTTFVGFSNSINTAMRKVRLVLDDAAENPRFIETVPRHGYRFIAPVERLNSSPPAQCNDNRSSVSLAISPLANLSAAANQQHVVDGLSDAIIAEAIRIPGLTLVQHGSATKCKDDRTSIAVAAQQTADVILEGNAVCCGTALRVTVRLFDTASCQYFWGEAYDRRLRDILALERELATSIVGSVAAKLISNYRRSTRPAATIESAVYDTYLNGRYFFSKRNADALRRGAESFQQAIERKPDYALAYVGLADCYNLFSWYGLLRPSEAFGRARSAAKKAVTLDCTLAEAHTSLACSILGLDWDWARAELEFKKAIELNPYYALGHQRYAEYLLGVGRPNEAITECKRGLEIEPLSVPLNVVLGRAYRDSRNYHRAVDQCAKAVDLDPTFAMGHFLLGLAHLQIGAYDSAVADELHAKSSGGPPLVLGALGSAYAAANKAVAALDVLEEIVTLSNSNYVSPYGVAMIYSALGDKNQAMQWLSRAYEERDTVLTWVKLDPQFDSLRSDARFVKLVRQIDLGA